MFNNNRVILLAFVLCFPSILLTCSSNDSTEPEENLNSIKSICTNNISVELPEPGFVVNHALSDISRPTRSHTEPYTGSIADVHLHWGKEGDMNEEYFTEIGNTLQENDVELAIFMPKPGDPNNRLYDQVAKIIELNSENFKVFFGGDYLTAWLDMACISGYEESDLSEYKNQLRDDLTNPQCSGIGELGIFHFEKFQGQSVYQYQPNFQPFLDFLDIIDEANAWLDIHAEPYDQDGNSYEVLVFGMLELIHERNPNIRLIYSHSGMTNPTNAERILDTYPSVVMNIKLIFDEWNYLEPINNSNGELYEDWAQLFERMPERFMIGTDAKFKDEVGFEQYDALIQAVRFALGSLNAEAMNRIAIENAEELFY